MSTPPATPFSSKAAHSSPTGFDRMAWCYDALAGLVFGPAQRRAQLAALAGLPMGAPHVLILGGGTGRGLLEVLRRRPQATVLYLEASPNMLVRARTRLARACPAASSQVAFRHGTQAALTPSERFDSIVTFFVLDCIALPELPGALAQLRAAQRPGATWLLAEFRPARRGWRWLLLKLMYAFFRLTTGLRATELPMLRPLLAHSGLRARNHGTFFGGAIEAVVFSENLPAPNL